MSIITTLSKSEFIYKFKTIRPGNFSKRGLSALYEHLEQLSEDIGEHIELDVIALCCDYSEEEPREFMEQYNIEVSEGEDMREEVFAYLQHETTVIEVYGRTSIIIQNF